MACKTWVRFLFLLKPHTSKRWGRGGGEGKPRGYQQNDVNKGHVFSPLLLLTKVRALELSPRKTPSPQRGNSPKRDAKHWRGSEDGHHWGWTAVQVQILCVQCGCWWDPDPRAEHEDAHRVPPLYPRGWVQKSCGHFGLEVSQEPLLFGAFPFTIFLFQFRFKTPVYDRYFYT